MSLFACIATSLLVSVVSGLPADGLTAPRLGYEVIEKLPHDPDAFTEGLFYTNGTFIESTGMRGQSFIKQWIPETGEIINVFETPANQFGEGVVQHGDNLYHLTYKAGTGYVVDAKTWQVKRKWSYMGEGWGLTVHPTEPWIYMSDGSEYIRVLSPETLEEIAPRIKVTDGGKGVTWVNELEYINGEIWANIWQSFIILRINPTTGVVNSILDLRGILTQEDYANGRRPDVLNGIAYDPDTGRIWVTGKYYPLVFEIKVEELNSTESTSTAASAALTAEDAESQLNSTIDTSSEGATPSSTDEEAAPSTSASSTASASATDPTLSATTEDTVSADALETAVGLVDTADEANEAVDDVNNENADNGDQNDLGEDESSTSGAIENSEQSGDASAVENGAGADDNVSGKDSESDDQLMNEGIDLNELHSNSSPSESKLYLVTGITGLFAFMLIGAYVVFRRKPHWFRGEPNYELELNRQVNPTDDGQSPAYAFLMDNDSDNEEFDDW